MENKGFFAELEIVRFDDTDVITAGPCAGDGYICVDCQYDYDCGCDGEAACALEG